MATKLLKKNNDRLLTLKAYNGRCALLWLEDRVRAAASIQDYVDRDPQLILCSDAMSLECVYYKCYCCACMCLCDLFDFLASDGTLLYAYWTLCRSPSVPGMANTSGSCGQKHTQLDCMHLGGGVRLSMLCPKAFFHILRNCYLHRRLVKVRPGMVVWSDRHDMTPQAS